MHDSRARKLRLELRPRHFYEVPRSASHRGAGQLCVNDTRWSALIRASLETGTELSMDFFAPCERLVRRRDTS